MNLDEIPKEKKDDFPIGVSEVIYETHAEIEAFWDGLNYAGDLDVESGPVFVRDDQCVMRVRVGDFDEVE